MPTDWEAQYQKGETPWDKGAPSPGLVDFLAPSADLEATASRYAMGLLANSQQSIRIAKTIINSVSGVHIRPEAELQQTFESTCDGQDFREGYAAFIAKRRPRFE